MKDLTSPRLMYLKAALFVLIGCLACALILLDAPTLGAALKVALLLAVAIWSFARAYYFAFYVVERYIDPSYRFAGLFSLLRYLLGRRLDRR